MSSPPGLATLTLYSRQWCHLCHDMEAALRALQGELGFALTVLDVDADPALEARFNELVPVLMAGDIELARYLLDEVAFRRDVAGIVQRVLPSITRLG